MDAAVTTVVNQMRVVMLLWIAVVAIAFGVFIAYSLRKQRRARRPQGPAPALLSALAGAGDTVVIDPGRTQIIAPIEQPALADEPTVVVDTIGSQGRELDRFADEVAVAAKRATVMAERRREQWQAAQRTREAAWDAYNRADADVRRLERAAVFPTIMPADQESTVPAVQSTEPADQESTVPADREPADEPRPAPQEPDAMDIAGQERYFRRLVTAAYQRGELSGAQLRAALAHRDGWDPQLHPFELQLKLRRLHRERCLRAYQEAAAVEQAAWHASDLAAAARSALHAEALAAEHRHTAHQLQLTTAAQQRVNRAKSKSAAHNSWSRSRTGELAAR